MAKVIDTGSTKRVLYTPDIRHLGILSYGRLNDLPQRIKETILNSPAGVECDEIKAEYLYGRGFKEETIHKLIINSKKQSLGLLYKNIAKNEARFGGCSYLIRRNGAFEIIGIEKVPFEFCRLGLPDENGEERIAVHHDWADTSGKQFKKSEIKWFSKYTNELTESIQQAENAGGFDKWNGQIVYFTNEGDDTYPLAPCNPVFQDIETDYLMKLNAWRQAKKGFMPGGIFVRRGVPAIPTDAEESIKDESEQEALNFAKNINENQGVENSNNIIVIDSAAAELDPVLLQFDVKDRAAQFKETAEMVRMRIIGCYKQPLIFHAQRIPSGMSDEKSLWDASKIHYSEITASERTNLALSLLPVLNEMFPAMNINEASLEVLPIIDPTIALQTNNNKPNVTQDTNNA